MKNQQLHELFVHMVQDLYDAEQQIIAALPKMIEAAQDAELKNALEEHAALSEEQASRLEEIAESLKFSVKGEGCKGMQGLLQEGEEVLKMHGAASPVRDLAIIAAAQKVEHYEISGYGSARALAECMEHFDAVDLLDQTAEEEGETDHQLTDIADSIIGEMEMEGEE